MANRMQFKRGDKADLPLLDCGEPAVTIDTKEFYIGVGDENLQLARQKDFEQLKDTLCCYEKTENRNVANGYPSLDHNSKIPMNLLNDALLGNVNYQGTWDAETNTPSLPSVPEQKGHYYITKVAGTKFGIKFNVGDWIISNGTEWDIVVNTDAVTSINGRIGSITLNKSDVDLSKVDNTSDNEKPISELTQEALNSKAAKNHIHNLNEINLPPGYMICYVSDTPPVDTNVIWIKP